MPDDVSARRIPPNPDERRVDRFAVGHDAFQFRFDLWQSSSDENRRGVTRILTDAATAREFSRTLRESLRDYDREGQWTELDAKRRGDT
jgi:hypothetical protein